MQAPVVKGSTGTPAINTAVLTQRLTLLGTTIATIPATSVTGAAITLQVLQQPALLALATKDQNLASQLASIKTQTEAALKDAQTKQTAYQAALAIMLQNATKLLQA